MTPSRSSTGRWSSSTLLEELKSTGETEPLPAADEMSSAEEWGKATGALSGQVVAAVVGDEEPGVGLAAGRPRRRTVFCADIRRRGMEGGRCRVARAVADRPGARARRSRPERSAQTARPAGPSAQRPVVRHHAGLLSAALGAARPHLEELVTLDRLGHSRH